MKKTKTTKPPVAIRQWTLVAAVNGSQTSLAFSCLEDLAGALETVHQTHPFSRVLPSRIPSVELWSPLPDGSAVVFVRSVQDCRICRAAPDCRDCPALLRNSALRLSVCALSPNGKPLRIGELLSFLKNLRLRRWRERLPHRSPPSWNGLGPVPGTGSVHFSHKRHNPAVFSIVRESVDPAGESPNARCARRRRLLPDPWDLPFRRPERNWKAQGKRGASWDRLGLGRKCRQRHCRSPLPLDEDGS